MKGMRGPMDAVEGRRNSFAARFRLCRQQLCPTGPLADEVRDGDALLVLISDNGLPPKLGKVHIKGPARRAGDIGDLGALFAGNPTRMRSTISSKAATCCARLLQS